MARDLDIGQFIKTLGNLFTADVFGKIMQRAADKTGVRAVEIILDEYPPDPPEIVKPPAKRSPPALRTPKQHRWWWAQMRDIAEGKTPPDNLRGWKASYRKIGARKTLIISGQYKRTGTLVRSITHEVGKDSKGTLLSVGASMARAHDGYASYVIDQPPPKGEQAAIHQGRWTPLVEIMQDHLPELYANFLQNVMGEMSDYARHAR